MMDIAIIGAGLAGSAAADRLVRAGRGVTVFDKSRGTGGRLATRRGDAGAFDHGAPLAQGDADFDAAMSRIGAAPHLDGWRGRPGMSGLVKPLLRGVDLRSGCRIARIDHADGWRLQDGEGTGFGPYRHLLIAIPAPQAADLRPHPDLGAVRMAPCWTLMAVWPGLDRPGPAAPLVRILPMGAHPDAAPGALVAHADRGWSVAHLEDDAATVSDMLVAALAGSGPGPTHARAHRWRFALVDRALGRPFLDTGDGCLLGGDWALGPRAGDAWASGHAMAEHVLGNAGAVG